MREITDFRGKVAVITGAGSGIGAALVDHAAELNMRIALADIDEAAINRRHLELRAQGVDCVAYRIDVADPGDLQRLSDCVYERWAATDLLVNNAGIELHGNTWELGVESWRRVVDVNLNGAFYGIRAFLPRMVAQGTRAHIVNVASVAALRVNPGTSSYAATKHGNLALTECLALEVAAVSDLVVVSAALPGAVRTQIMERSVSADDAGIGAASKRRLTEELSRDGIEPAKAARVIFHGAARGDLRIHTHPDVSRAFIARRAKDLASDV